MGSFTVESTGCPCSATIPMNRVVPMGRGVAATTFFVTVSLIGFLGQLLYNASQELSTLKLEVLALNQKLELSALSDQTVSVNQKQQLLAETASVPKPPTEMTFLQVAKSRERVSDKVSRHTYYRMYQHFLSPLRHKDIKMLEIGLGCNMGYGPGASVDIWDAFFTPGSEIWEAEYNAKCVEKHKGSGKLGRVKAVTGDQEDPATLDRWISETGGDFDFVIDDGGHQNSQILASFKKLWPIVKPGGLYFIEDMHVGRRKDMGYSADGAGGPVMADVIEAWIDQLIITTGRNFAHNDGQSVVHKLPHKVHMISCLDEACVISKCPADDNKYSCA